MIPIFAMLALEHFFVSRNRSPSAHTGVKLRNNNTSGIASTNINVRILLILIGIRIPLIEGGGGHRGTSFLRVVLCVEFDDFLRFTWFLNTLSSSMRPFQVQQLVDISVESWMFDKMYFASNIRFSLYNVIIFL